MRSATQCKDWKPSCWKHTAALFAILYPFLCPFASSQTLTKEYIYLDGTLIAIENSGPPPAPTNLSPGDGATNVSLNPTLSWSASPGATSYDVYLGTSSTPPFAANVTGAAYAPSTLIMNTRYYWRVTAKNSWGSNSSSTISFTSLNVPTPQSVSAQKVAPTSIRITWSSSSAADQFEIERYPARTWTVAGGSGNQTAYDNSVSSGVTYVYRVRARVGSCWSNYSNRDLATMIAFTDDPVSNTVTVRAQHFSELRQAVADVRSAASLAAPVWSYPNLSGQPIRAIDLQEIRNKLNEALAILQISAPTYTDTLTPYVMVVKAVHIQEIRNFLK